MHHKARRSDTLGVVGKRQVLPYRKPTPYTPQRPVVSAPIRRQYLSGITPLWSLPALLLAARRLDVDAGCGRWLVDGWLLLRLHDGAGPKVGGGALQGGDRYVPRIPTLTTPC